MRTAGIFLSTFIAGCIASASPYSPFFLPLESSTTDRTLNLFRRQNYCASGQQSCSNLGQPSTCCKKNSACAIDQAGNVACCPTGAACTGSISIAVPTITSSGTAQNAALSTAGPLTTPSTNNAAQITSTVQNPYFPFVYVPTTYSNAAGCSSYYSSCQSEFASCTSSVGGGVNGVTVAGAGGGITVQGASATAAASSICASLSSSACSGLQIASCSAYGSGATFIQPNAAPSHCAGIYGMGVGVAIGIGGQLLG